MFDRESSIFGNFDSTTPVDVVGMKSYMDDTLFDPTCEPVRVTINKFNRLLQEKNFGTQLTTAVQEGGSLWSTLLKVGGKAFSAVARVAPKSLVF